MLTPVVHEVPQVYTTRLPNLHSYATQALEQIVDVLHASAYLHPSQRSSLDYVEQELRERAQLEVALDEFALAA
jgi:hypothetical protein